MARALRPVAQGAGERYLDHRLRKDALEHILRATKTEVVGEREGAFSRMPPLRDAHAFEISPGVRMPRLGLGTFKVRGEDATRATLAALRAGCRHVDTASCYRNEEAIRDAVEMWKDETKGGGAPTTPRCS